ncbi:MAG TPA: RIP metalloprotease RseP, partial [Candidatus Binataceae bacterium]|nr:RIP metalloprotease RseP [Candidatus Binataceae bacterium]
MLTSIISAVIILGTLVLIHEAGHFAVAKRCGVRVLRFSIGYPPKLFGIRRGETEYAIGGTPFGGYVRMLGDEIGDELGPSDIQLFLTEVGRDLLDAATRVGATEPELRSMVEAKSASRGQGDVLDQAAGRNAPAPGNGAAKPGHREAKPGNDEANFDGLYALTQALGSSPDPERLLRKILGRAPREEERELLDEVQRRKDSAEAIKFLAEHRTPGLTRQIEKRSFPTQSLGKRFLIVLAGPAANIALAPVLLAFVFMYGVPKLLPVLGALQKGMPAAKAGLHAGDRIISIDGQPIHDWEDLSASVKKSGGAPLKIELQRAGAKQVESITITPVRMKEPGSPVESAQWVMGVLPRGDSIVTRENPFYAVPHAVMETGRLSGMLVVGIAKIITGDTPVRQALGGPIMIAQLAGREARQGLASVLMFTVMLSVELGIINLLPIPMLDGGHLFFFVVEGLRGRPLKVRHREIAQQVGLFLLVMLMAFVIFN